MSEVEKDLRERLAQAEAKCERLKEALRHLLEGINYEGNEVPESLRKSWQLRRAQEALAEPPSTSLTNYTREQTDEVKEALVKTVKWLVSYTDIIEENPLLDDVVSPALAKLKEVRGEK